MQETTQPSIARRSIFASIDVTDTLVRRAARTYSTIRGVLMTASERLDHFDSRLPPLLRRPLARTATSSPSQRPRYECPQTVTTSRRRSRTTSRRSNTNRPPSLCDRLPPAPPALHSPPVPGPGPTARPSPVNAPPQPSHPTLPTPSASGPKPTLRAPHFNLPPARSARMRPQTPPERPYKRASRPKPALSGPFRSNTRPDPRKPCYGPLRPLHGPFHRSPEAL